jgi:hypothetical protein
MQRSDQDSTEHGRGGSSENNAAIRERERNLAPYVVSESVQSAGNREEICMEDEREGEEEDEVRIHEELRARTSDMSGADRQALPVLEPPG